MQAGIAYATDQIIDLISNGVRGIHIYTMNKPEWVNQENDEYRVKTERRFAEYFTKHKSLWDSVPTADKVKVSAHAREKVMRQGMLLEAATIFDWLKGVEKCLQDE